MKKSIQQLLSKLVADAEGKPNNGFFNIKGSGGNFLVVENQLNDCSNGDPRNCQGTNGRCSNSTYCDGDNTITCSNSGLCYY
jgi:hypothetical protein